LSVEDPVVKIAHERLERQYLNNRSDYECLGPCLQQETAPDHAPAGGDIKRQPIAALLKSICRIRPVFHQKKLLSGAIWLILAIIESAQMPRDDEPTISSGLLVPP